MQPPNLYIVGPPRTGTTSVARWLGRHDAIVMSRPKETGYHCSDLEMDKRITDPAEYVRAFAASGTSIYRGEATPWYLYSEAAAASIHAMEPDSRIIIHLRDPVDALASLHNHHVFMGIEPEHDFERAVLGPRRAARGDFRSSLDYLSVARLAPQVKRYCDLFPRDHIIRIDFDEMGRSPRDTHLEILKRLDLEAVPLDEYPYLNRGRHVRSETAQRVVGRLSAAIPRGKALRVAADRLNVAPGRTEPPPKVRARIIEALEDDITELESLFDRDLSSWRQVRRPDRSAT